MECGNAISVFLRNRWQIRVNFCFFKNPANTANAASFQLRPLHINNERNVQSYRHADPHRAVRARIWPSDLRVSACRGPAMDYMSTDFGADSSNRFPFRAQRNRCNWTPYPMPAAIQPVWKTRYPQKSERLKKWSAQNGEMEKLWNRSENKGVFNWEAVLGTDTMLSINCTIHQDAKDIWTRWGDWDSISSVIVTVNVP